MLLAIDIGNTNVVLALHDGNNWVGTLRIPTLVEELSLYYKMGIVDYFLEQKIGLQDVKKTVLSSVVPDLKIIFEAILQELFNQTPIIAHPSSYSKVSLSIDRHDEIGTDLFANAVAAYKLFQRDCIVVDFGTALTFTVVSGEGVIQGVNIAPGIKTAIRSLMLNTAQLPEVPLQMPKTVIGKNTTTAIQNGILRGYIGLVRYQIECIRKELGMQYIAVATGGLSGILIDLEDDFEFVDKNLTLEGLRLIGEG